MRGFLGDGAFMIPTGNGLVSKASATSDPSSPNVEIPVAELESPDLVPRQTAMTFSLADAKEEVEGDGRHAIDGIFEMIEMPSPL